jgi:hypothetical protein
MLRIIIGQFVVFVGLLTLVSGCNVDRIRGEKRAPLGAPLAAPTGQTHVVRDAAATDLRTAAGEEVDLVEAVVDSRTKYHRSLADLQAYYEKRGYAAKQSWADFELAGLKKVKAFRYLDEAEVPEARLDPKDSITEADAQFERGLELMRKGGHGVPVFYRQKNMIEAADVFRGLVEAHPTSDKIDDAAFYLGEIHKEYLPNQESLAVRWYERCWTWNPQSPHPARFQAAVVYDFRLHDRDKALELYKSVLQVETSIASNVRFAQRRIGQLTSEHRSAQAARPQP